jgi:hypothetical protein
MGFDFAIDYEGIHFDPRKMWFRPLKSSSSPDSLGLRVSIPNLTPTIEPQANNAVAIILDTALGERAAALEFQHLEILALPELPESLGYFPLPELHDYLDWRKRKVSGTQ